MGSSKPRILVVEDNPVEQKLVSVLAARCGVEAEVVGTGYRAVQLVSENGYSAVLMNYMMPAMTGAECALRIRELEGGRQSHVPIIAVTAAVMDDAREQCLAAGMDDFLSKPYTVQQFVDVIERWVQSEKNASSVAS